MRERIAWELLGRDLARLSMLLSTCSFGLLALSNFAGKTEKCGRRHFHFANFATLSGHTGGNELQRDSGRQ